MTQPEHVPLQATDRVRPSMLLPPPGHWQANRPGDLLELETPQGPLFGAPGPDLGYGLKLARGFEDRLELVPGELVDDAVFGCFACGSRRAGSFGRAPVVWDMEWAYALWGFLGGAPEDLLEWRQRLFRGAAGSYWVQRRIVDVVRIETLSLTPAELRQRLGAWKELLIA